MSPLEWRRTHPEVFFLDRGDVAALALWLRQANVTAGDEAVVGLAKAGEGNMNCTLRVTTDRRSLIVKQARPWVEKYPQFAAPWDRSCREAEFYALAREHPPVAGMMPKLLHADAEARVLVLEDLGLAADYSGIYGGGDLPAADVGALARWLSELQRFFFAWPDRRGLANRGMRALNHHHIFVVPLQPELAPDLDATTPGLAGEAEALRADEPLGEAVRTLAEVYLADGACLTHGDFFPGSFLRTAEGPKVIDPEFAFFGRPEFDPAVFVAHLLLAGQDRALVTVFRTAYVPPLGFDAQIMLQLAGVEIMRRLVGYAQLPLGMGLEEKRRLLALARELILHPARVSL